MSINSGLRHLCLLTIWLDLRDARKFCLFDYAFTFADVLEIRDIMLTA